MFIPKFGMGKLAIFLLPAVLARFSRKGDDDDPPDDGDEEDTEPGLKEKLGKLFLTLAASQALSTVADLFKIYLKMEIQPVAGGVKVDKLSPDEMVSKFPPYSRDGDFVSKSVVRSKKHPPEGNYILVDFHKEDATFAAVFVLAGLMGWKRPTPDEAMAVWQTNPSAALWEPKPIVCTGMVLSRPRAHVIDLTVPFLGFGVEKDKKDEKTGKVEKGEKFYGVGLCDLFQPIGDRKLLFRVRDRKFASLIKR